MIKLDYRLSASDFADHSTTYSESGVRFPSFRGEIDLYVSDVLRALFFSGVPRGVYYEQMVVVSRTHEALPDVLDIEFRLCATEKEYKDTYAALYTYYHSHYNTLPATIQTVPLERIRPLLPDGIETPPMLLNPLL